LSKQDKLYKDAIITAAASNSVEVAEDLLSYFVDIGNKECFAAVLYICFDLLRSDVIEELSWQHGLNDFYMPYKIQNQRSLVDKVRNITHQWKIFIDCPITLDCSAREGGQGEIEKRYAEGAAGG
jgi:clathrin heavy chain